jgi:hypothetical protein
VGKVTNLDWDGSPEAKDARRRATLSETCRILAARCPDAQVRLFDFSIELRDGKSPFTWDGLHEAAETLIACVQDELSSRRSPLDLRDACELVHSRLWAIHALALLTGSHAHAKRFEVGVASGRPLTVCYGSGPLLPPVAGFQRLQAVDIHLLGKVKVQIPRRGCLAIIPESTRVGGVMWRYWCSDCAPSRGAKARSQARAHRRMANRFAQRCRESLSARKER